MINILLQALLFGVLGLLVEDVFTGVASLLRGDRKATTTSYLYMPVVWALGGLFFRLVAPGVEALPWFFARWLVWMALIYVLEAISGSLLKRWLGLVPWDYSESRGSALGGTVNLLFIPYWLALAVAVSPVLHFVAWMASRLLN